jgi:hypothetical protein
MSIFSDYLVGGRGIACEFIVAGASDAHKKVKIDLIRDRLEHNT